MATRKTALSLAVSNIVEGEELDKLIKSVGTRGKKLDADQHNMLVGSLADAMTATGDTRLKRITSAVAAMPRGANTTGYIGWIAAFAPIAINRKTGKVRILGEQHKDYSPWDIDGANAKPFWEFKPEAQRHLVDEVALARKLTKWADEDDDEAVSPLARELCAALNVELERLLFEIARKAA